MADRPIAFVDSGVGGLPYLAAAQAVLPLESMIYVADSANFPYGEKSAFEVQTAVAGVVARLFDTVDPKIVVIACNTASVAALAFLRERFPIPFVGVVPAVKPAALRTAGGRIGVLATSRTVQDRYLTDLIQQHAASCQVAAVAAKDLVEFVEHRFVHATAQERREAVRSAARELTEQKVDTVVLGCTHFIHLRDDLQEELGEGVAVVDSVEGVSRQVARILDEIGERATGSAQRLFYATDGNAARYREFALRYGLEVAGTL